MKTEILTGAPAIKKGSKIIKDGGVVAFPTETVYGLGANAYDEKAVLKIFEAKMRPQDNPLIVHISDIEEIYKIAKDVSEDAIILSRRFMPGPITLVMKKLEKIPMAVTAGLDTVGIRMPSHPVARELIKSAGVPIAAPSANISTHTSPTTAIHVFNDLNGRIPLIIEGGNSEVGIESTVIDVSSDKVTILRPGAVTKKMIESILHKEVSEKYLMSGTPASPGMKYRHYAPKVPVRVIKNKDEISALYDRKVSEGFNPVVLTLNNEYPGRNTVNLGKTSQDAAKNIYAALRDSEEKYDFIISEDYDDGEIGKSVMNRLNKASENV